jgi:hypothetical protein
MSEEKTGVRHLRRCLCIGASKEARKTVVVAYRMIIFVKIEKLCMKVHALAMFNRRNLAKAILS